MRIGLLSPSIYMSPTRYKDMIFAPRDLAVSLANGLVKKRHKVYFFTAPDIETQAELVGGDKDLLERTLIEEKLQDKGSERLKWASFYTQKRNFEMDLTTKCYKMAMDGKLDIVHSYHDTFAHFLNDFTNIPTVYTLHDPLPQNPNSLAYWLLKKFHNHNFVSISDAFRKGDSMNLNFVKTIYHGIDISKYTSSLQGNYLAFIGRMVKEKGIEFAIDAAKQSLLPLKIATSIDQSAKVPYYDEVISPKVDGKLISIVNFLQDKEKIDFLAQAICLLFPIQWEEPFGLVMIEAMACGTPVIAYNRGSVPEVVRDGLTGFIVEPDGSEGKSKWVIKKKGIEGLIEAIKRIEEIDRRACRKHVEDNFTVEKMVEGYERVYKDILKRS